MDYQGFTDDGLESVMSFTEAFFITKKKDRAFVCVLVFFVCFFH